MQLAASTQDHWSQLLPGSLVPRLRWRLLGPSPGFFKQGDLQTEIHRAYHVHIYELCTQVTVPYLRSEYGKEFDFDAPVKLLDAMMHEQAQEPGQQVCWAPLRCP